MNRQLPPMNPLRVFECAARHESFTKAADELHVSQSAVSRQIATLEGYLSVRLFDRDRGGVRLTNAGTGYHQEIAPAFATIGSATYRLRETKSEAALKLGIYSTFAARWLMHRLPRFQMHYPKISLRITSIVTPVDFSKNDIDAAVQFGDGQWSGADAEYLMADRAEPVCNPSLLEAGPEIKKPLDVLAYPLLHSYYRKADWPDWCRTFRLKNAEPETGSMVFPSSLLTYEAAIQGLGVAMGQTRLLTAEFAAGKLIRPIDAPLERHLAYYLVTPDNVTQGQKFKQFRRWLLAEISNGE